MLDVTSKYAVIQPLPFLFRARASSDRLKQVLDQTYPPDY